MKEHVLLDTALHLCPAFVLLSVNFELLFFSALCFLLLAWIRIAERRKQDRTGTLVASDIQDALVYIFLVILQNTF